MVLLDPGRPTADEYPPFFAGYVARVPDGHIATLLQNQLEQVQAILAPLNPAQVLDRPTPTDWNLLEVLGHMTDGEQIFAFRALHIARGDTTPLAGFEQDDYVRMSQSADRTLADMLDAYVAQRRATLAMLRSFNAEAWLRRGTVAGRESSVRAWIYIITGHELYHIEDFHGLYGIPKP